MKKYTGLIMIMIVFNLFAGSPVKNLYVLPKYDNVCVYENPVRLLNENSAFRVNLEARLLILEITDDCYRVQDGSGRTGWIEKRHVALSKDVCSLEFDPKDVTGYDDDKPTVIIHDYDGEEDTRIKLDRSFAENLKCNVDREALLRQVK